MTRTKLVEVVHEALEPAAITAELVKMWGEAPSYVNPVLNEMLQAAIADAVILRVTPLLDEAAREGSK